MDIEPLYQDQAPLRYSDLLTSEMAGWSSLVVRLTKTVANGDEFESAPMKDLAIHIVLEEELGREVFVSGGWRRPEVRRGTIAITSPRETWRQRYNNRQSKNMNRMIHFQIPLPTFHSVAEQFPTRNNLLQTGIRDDKAITHFGLSVLKALKAGASDLYAQASAQWLSTHLVLGAEKAAVWHAAIDDERIPDRRLIVLLEYMREHLHDDLSLQALAKLSGLSQFQVATLFQGTMEKSPHKHVLHLRMQNAAHLLRETNRSVSEIAALCGFKTASHFGVAFRKHFSRSATQYRFAQKMSDLAVPAHL